jgi:L-fucose isomerase-like protein
VGGADRGVVRVKPIYVGLYHYRYAYGSVVSPDVTGTPPVSFPSTEELEKAAREMVEKFKKSIHELDFVVVEEPFIIKSHEDVRRVPSVLTYDTDATLIGTYGCAPLEVRAILRYGLPVAKPDPNFMRALRVKKFLGQSKVLYIGEIPSFSAPDGPWDFFAIEDRLGVRFRQVETSEFFRVFSSIPVETVRRKLEEWKSDFAAVVEPSERDLMEAVRVYLALRLLCDREDANAVTINCGRFTEESAARGCALVPCLAFAKLIDEGIVCGCEGDVTAILSALVLHAVSGQPVLMGNFGYRPGQFGAREGEVTIEHDVIPLSMASTKFTIRDYHGRKFGVTGYADVKTGQPMTLLNIDKSLRKMCVIEGTVKDSEDGIHCRVIIHMSVNGDLRKIPEILVGSQHISMTYGHWLGALKEVGNLLGFEIKHL